MRKKKEKTLNKDNILLLSPEEIDAIISNRILSFPKKGNKTSAIGGWKEEELELRDAVILAYLTEEHLSYEKTAQQLAARWPISMSTARRYTKEAISRFCLSHKKDLEETKELFLEELQNIIREARDNGSRDTSLKGLDMVAKVLGFYKDNKELNINGSVDINFDFKE